MKLTKWAFVAAFTAFSSLPAMATLIVTPAGQTLGFTASTVVTGFPSITNEGPFGLAMTGNGKIMVSDFASATRYIFNDVDNQTVANAIATQTSDSSAGGYANLNGIPYGVAGGHFVQFNNDGTVNHQIVPSVSSFWGLAADPVTGKLIASISNGMIEIDPIANTFRVIVTGFTPDGISVSPDGTIAYVAYNGTTIAGYNIATGALVFNPLSISGADGTAVIVSNNSLNGKIVVNDNFGNVSLVDPVTRQVTVIAANAGQRGDYVAPDITNGTLLLDYSTEVSRLSCGSGCSIGAPAPPISSAPEPSSFLLAGMGLGALLYARRRMQQR